MVEVVKLTQRGLRGRRGLPSGPLGAGSVDADTISDDSGEQKAIADKIGPVANLDDAADYPNDSVGFAIINSRASERTVFDWLTFAQKGEVLSGTQPTLDMTAKIQEAVDDMAGGHLVFPPGLYRLNGAVNVLSALTMDFSSRRANILLGTQNQNGFVIGDGSSPTRSALFGTTLIEPAFTPISGVPAFTTGACIYENYVGHVDVIRPSFYGRDGVTSKLWDGLRQHKVIESDSPDILAQYLRGSGTFADGEENAAGCTSDCNYDNFRGFNCGYGLNFGIGTAGLGAYRPTMYGNTVWNIYIHANSGPYGQNYFIDTPDIEIASAASGGIWVQGGGRASIREGWVGIRSGTSLKPAVLFDSAADSCSVSCDTYGAYIELAGQQNWVSGGDICGDASTSGANGVIIKGAGCGVGDDATIRQWLGNGIDWGGQTPANVEIGSVLFLSNGRDIASLDPFIPAFAPVIASGNTDKTRFYTAAATLDVPANMPFIQVSGGTSITTIKPHGRGKLLTVQATGGSITLASGGNLVFPGAPLTIASGQTVTLVCDGDSWFLAGKSF